MVPATISWLAALTVWPEPPRRPGGAVVADDVEAGPDQVGRHRAAHDAEADEPDGGHVAPPCRRCRGSQAKLSALAPLGWYSSPTQPE
jgi:hypothetical protein